ncbi:M20 family metallopeptidase [Ornithinicoccus hortensis]|uniref:M20 family metallopeptidase n=1 Tax=Ornithinicoccus hortensis TaxID=82346 RepID=UPI001E4BDD54|nr:M20 family metallopeptidase [Ornithinicoccus hortensis]
MPRAEVAGPTPREQEVLDLIDPADLVALTRALVRVPGTNPPGEEQGRAELLASVCRERGFSVDVTEVAPGRPNVSAVLPGGDGSGLLLLGHTDVVPLGEGWTVDPFGGELRDGRVYGRGSTDMLGGLAASVVAMDALRRAGVALAGPLELAAVVDEEMMGLGIRDYVRDPGRLRLAGCIVAEPTDLQLIIAARGASYVEVEIEGVAAHAGNPDDGRNAIYGAAAVVTELERWHHELAADAHPLVGPATWNVGVVTGGSGGSTVPARCHIAADRRLLPEEDPAEVLAAIRARLDLLDLPARGLGIEVTMPMDMPGFETSADHPLVRAADSALATAGGPGLPLAGWTAACDGGFLARDAGVPVVVLGPGSVADQAHRPDESVGVDELLVAARAYALAALRLLGP